ncbi:FAD-dependent oxidoreductase [Azospirillum argentinense]
MGKTRVLVLGGGLGGVSAALTLTATEALREKFDVTLVSHGWRLGGKGASGRNAKQGQRIEEHGLHVFLGFYDNAFRMVRGAYAEWDEPADYAFQTWQDAFHPLYQVTLMQDIPRFGKTRWHSWNLDFPERSGTPGDPRSLGPNGFAAFLIGALQNLVAKHDHLPGHLTAKLGLDALEKARAHIEEAGDGALDHGLIVDLLKLVQKGFQAVLEPLLKLSDEGWEFACFADFGLAFAIGCFADVLPYGKDGFDRINGEDFREWLQKNGISDTFAWSAPVRLLYDMCFSYKNGEATDGPENARFAAGAAAEILLLMGFAYKGAPLWKMNAGMGDTVFTPAWFVLKQRGVDIKLFHRLTKLETSENGAWVERVRLNRQVDLVNGAYDPFVKVGYGDDGKWLYCWPSEPDWSQIVDGDKIRDAGINLESVFCHCTAGESVLEVGKDFDLVVLAMPPAALADPAAELMGANLRFKQMVEVTPAVPTQAVQLWMTPSIEEMGWKAGPTAMTSYVEELDSWGEMSHLIPAESWPPGTVKAVEYFCGTARWPAGAPPYACGLPQRMAADVRRDATEWLNANIGVLWPNTVKDGVFDQSQVYSSYYRYNLDPSELYVQCFPATVETRLKPGDSGFVNAFLAGDWTRTWFSAGSAEIAVLSGKQAAEAIARQTIDLTPSD